MKGKLNKLEALYRINESILSILEINTLLNKSLEVMENTFGFDNSAILFYDETSNELYIRSSRGYSQDAVKQFRTSVGGQGVTGYVAESKEPLFIPNIEKESRYVPGVAGAKCEIAIPLLVDGKLIGVLDIESEKEYSYTQDDFEVLCMFAAQISLAIHNAMAYEDEKKKVNQLLLLNDIRTRLSMKQRLDKLLETAATSVVELLRYYHILIFLWDEESQQLKVVAQAGIEKKKLEPELEDILAAKVMEKSFVYDQTLVVRDQKSRLLKSGFDRKIQSELVVPLKIDRSFVGAVYVANESKFAFDEQSIRILEAIRDQLVVIIKDAALYSDISKRSKQLEIMHKIGRVPIQSFDFKKFVDEIARLIQKTFGFYQVSIFSYEKISGQLEMLADAGEPLMSLKVGDKISEEAGIIGYVARSGSYYLCNDISRETRYMHEVINTKSELTLPIKNNDEVLGVLNLESPRLNQFDKSDVKIFNRIAEQIAYTISNAELFRQKSSAHTLLLNLNNLSREINATFDLEKAIDAVIERLPGFLQCRFCSIFFYYPEEQKLVLRGHNIPGAVMNTSLTVNASSNVLMNRVIKLKRSIIVKDIERELNIRNNPQYQTKSFLNILLKNQEKIIGVLNLTDKLDGGSFSSQEFYLVNSFSEHLTVAIENANKYTRILELSITDGLTGLYVHRYFQEALSREISRADRYNMPLSLIMIDIDDFKLFNDTYGHQVGDIVLREIAILIKAELREHDIAARYGGEEFAVILPNTSLFQAKAFADRLQKKIANHVVIHSHKKLKITVSQGISEYDFRIEKNQFINRADMALLDAKGQGKDRVVVYAKKE